MIGSLRVIVFGLDGTAIGLDMSRFFAILAGSIFSGLALARALFDCREELPPQLFDQSAKPCTM